MKKKCIQCWKKRNKKLLLFHSSYFLSEISGDIYFHLILVCIQGYYVYPFHALAQFPSSEVLIWQDVWHRHRPSENTACAGALPPGNIQAPAQVDTHGTRSAPFVPVCNLNYKIISVPNYPASPGAVNNHSPGYGKKKQSDCVFISHWFHCFNYFHEWKEARRT